MGFFKFINEKKTLITAIMVKLLFSINDQNINISFLKVFKANKHKLFKEIYKSIKKINKI